MDLSMEMKKQLMEMAGMSDISEFDKMAQKVATSASQSIKASKKAQKTVESPFKGKFQNNPKYILFHDGCSEGRYEERYDVH
jgi:hypothetical protein